MSISSTSLAGYKFEISLRIQSEGGESIDSLARWDQTKVLITVTELELPMISIITASEFADGKLPVNGKVKLYGMLEWPSSLAVPVGLNISWDIDDPSIALADIAMTAHTMSLAAATVTPASSTQSGVAYLNLVVLTSLLNSRDTYVFSLILTDSNNGFLSKASIEFARNAPPTPGQFLIDPSSGIELTTLFTFSASLWDDPDLPISYEVVYFSSSMQVVTVHDRSSYATYSSYLPAGKDVEANNLVCSLRVYDMADAYTAMNYTVTVDPVGE